jgi:hypothetical protein
MRSEISIGLGLFIPEIIKKISCFQRKYLFPKTFAVRQQSAPDKY